MNNNNKLILDGYRIEKGHLTEEEKKIDNHSCRLFTGHTTALAALQQKILKDLNTGGVSVCHIDEFKKPAMQENFERLRAYFIRFRDAPNTEEVIQQKRKSITTWSTQKGFEINATHYLGRHLDLGDDVPEFFLDDELLTIAGHYLEGAPKAFHFNSWVHVTPPTTASRINSMRWHRDPEALRVFKIFVAAKEITPEQGPTQYIRGSHAKGKYSHLQEYRITNRYPPDGYIEKHVDSDDIVSVVGPPGTIAFIDTYGFHRGGYLQIGERHQAQGVFLKPNVLQLPKWQKQRIKLNIDHPSYHRLSPLAQYAANEEF